MLVIESYTDEMLRKRIFKGIPYLEVKLLDKLKRGISKSCKETNFGTVVFLDYKKKFFKGIQCDSIKLEVHLEGKYPFQAPKVILSTPTTFPSLADGRNLLQNIIKKSWSEDVTVLEIASLFPAFLSENHSNPSAGRFHLGQCMSLKYWENRDSMKLFHCQEIEPQNPKFSRDRALVISHSMILQLETNPQYQGLAHLVCYASIHSLSSVKVSKSDSEKVTFEWKIPDNSNLAQQFRIKNLQEFIELLLKNAQRLSISFDRRSLRPNPSISEEEVNAQALTRIKITEIMAGIIQHEVDIQDEMSKEKINELIELYQKAIEYFGALNDPKFKTYLEKVRKMLSDEIILDVLAGKPPPKKNVEIKPLEDKKVREFEEREIWPSGPPPSYDLRINSDFEEKKLFKKDEEDKDENEDEWEVKPSIEEDKKFNEFTEEEKIEEKNAKNETFVNESEKKNEIVEVNKIDSEVKETIEENKQNVESKQGVEKVGNLDEEVGENAEKAVEKKSEGTEKEYLESILNEEDN